MVRGYHVILSVYGFWLPNDPRGSGSRQVRNPILAQFGPAQPVQTEKSVAHRPHDPKARAQPKRYLKYAPVVLNGAQALAVARGIAQAKGEAGYRIYACAILPQHLHLIVARHTRPVERIIAHMKAKATRRLKGDGLHPAVPHLWARGARHRFLRSDDQMRRAIDYVQQNPLKEGSPRQNWSFVNELHG
jgi:REP element-mobilizing transposase RayT